MLKLVKVFFGRRSIQVEVNGLDMACDFANGSAQQLAVIEATAPPILAKTTHVLSSLSEEFKTGGNNPGGPAAGLGALRQRQVRLAAP